MKKFIGAILSMILLAACAPSADTIAKQTAVAATSTAAAGTPVPTTPFLGAATSGDWTSEDFSVVFDKQETTHIDFTIMSDGTSMMFFTFFACKNLWGNGTGGMNISPGIFSFTFYASMPSDGCNFTGNISGSGVFVSKDKVEGTLTIGSQTTDWVATPDAN